MATLPNCASGSPCLRGETGRRAMRRWSMPQEELLVVVASFLAMLGVAAFSVGLMLAYRAWG